VTGQAPNHPAVLLWVDLIDHLEALVALHREGRPADLEPLIHLIQDLVDAMAEHRPMLELLTAVRPPGHTPGPVLRQAVVTVHALAFGTAMELSRRELLVLGLSSSLAALAWGEGPEAVVASLLPLGSLGELAPEVLDAVHGMSTLAEPEESDRPAAVLSLISDYVMLLDGEDGRPPMAPAHALASLASGRHPRVDRRLARRLALMKGAWPVGSLLRLSNDRSCIVIGWSDGEMHGRPVVLPVDDEGLVGSEIDLAEMPGLHIVEAVSASRCGVDLTTIEASDGAAPTGPLGRVDGAQVSLSYELEHRLANQPSDADNSLDFDLSIEESMTMESMEVGVAVEAQTLEWR